MPDDDTPEVADGDDPLVERLAALEHRQWMHWSKNVAEANDIPDALHEKWRANWRPYAALDEATKEHDRKWAREAAVIARAVLTTTPDMTESDTEPDTADHAQTADRATVANEADMLDGYHAEDLIQEAIRRMQAAEETGDD